MEMPAASERSTISRSSVSGRLVAFLFMVSLGFATIPIFSCEFLSINDYLNHLSRAAVLLWYYDDPGVSSYFIPNWKPVPNLAFDIWIFGLGRFLPLPV